MFTSGHGKGTINVYTLNWSYKDEKVEGDHLQWLANHWPTKNIPVHNRLPEKWENWLSGIKYAIPSTYYKEISNQSHLAIEEWNREYPFDTVIREMCLQSAIAHVAVAFKLVADCAYDPATNYYSRGDDKIILKYALMYRFWIGQTGGGLLKTHSEFDHLNWLLTCDNIWHDRMLPARHVIEEFINDIDKFEKEWDTQHNKIYEDLPKFGGVKSENKAEIEAKDSLGGPISYTGDPK